MYNTSHLISYAFKNTIAAALQMINLFQLCLIHLFLDRHQA